MSDIDREVAEKTMGWGFQPETPLRAARYRRGDLDYVVASIWSPSTRIDHAWEVMEKFSEYSWTVEWHPKGGFFSTIFVETDCSPLGYGEAETAPLSICRAALAAVEWK